MIPTFIRSHVAAADIEPRRAVTYAAPTADKSVQQATGSTLPFVGVSDTLGADAGDMCDVHRAGLPGVKLGGTVQAGDPLTSDANGKAVKAVPGAGTTVYLFGYADEHGVADDIIDYFAAPGVLHQA